jgi:hypothetical protein
MDLDHNLVMGCPLCEIFLDNKNLKTQLYYPHDVCDLNSSDFIIIDCLTCKTPMVIVRDHVSMISSEMWGKILYKCRLMFGQTTRLRTQQRSIKDHVHYHIIK